MLLPQAAMCGQRSMGVPVVQPTQQVALLTQPMLAAPALALLVRILALVRVLARALVLVLVLVLAAGTT
jgi:hypothetical protein